MKKAKWILALLMAVLMVVTTIAPALALTGDKMVPVELVQKDQLESTKNVPTKGNRLTPKLDKADRSINLMDVKASAYDPDAIVTAIVVFDENGAVGMEEDQSSKKAIDARARMVNTQNEFVAKLNKKLTATVKFNYTVLLNGIAVETEYRNLPQIQAMDGVKGVYLSKTYSIPKLETPDANTANELTGISTFHNNGYEGKGTVIAVLDTGLNINHEAFQDYGKTASVITPETLESIDTLGNGLYVSNKVPFVYSYAIGSQDVTDTNGHGTHVSGIATGYVEQEDGAITFSGAAPAAQLLFMKITPHDNPATPDTDESGSTSSDIYLACFEDAYRLGADVINMSFGSANGFTTDPWEAETDAMFQGMYQKLDDAGVIVCISAGNSGVVTTDYASNSLESMYVTYPMVPAFYQDYSMVGAPSTYTGNLSVASVENAMYPADVIKISADSEEVFSFTDSCDDGVHGWMQNFAGQTLEFAWGGIGNPGELNEVNGKIAFIQRGELSFEEKADNAAAAGAIGVVVYDNAEFNGTNLSMSIESFDVPAIFIRKEAADIILASGTTTIYVPEGQEMVENPAVGQISNFSSWGATPSLTIAPQITGFGGMISSADAQTTDGYVVYSGTSMASPNVAGNMATLIGYFRGEYPDKTKAELANFVEAISKSTAYITTDSYDIPMPVRAQGSGIIQPGDAANSAVVITDPILNIGDSEDGNYTIEFEVENLLDATVYYEISPIFMIPWFDGGKLDDGVHHYWDTLTADIANNYCDWQSNYEDDILTLTPYETATVTINVTYDDAAYFGDYDQDPQVVAPNGHYFEGYVGLLPIGATQSICTVSFSTGETLEIVEGNVIDPADIPELPTIYGTRNMHWDSDLTAPVTDDLTVEAVYDTILYGDASKGGELDSGDAALVLRHVVRMIELDAEALENAAVTEPYNKLTAADAAAILRKVVGLIEAFPIELYNEQMNNSGAHPRRFKQDVPVDGFEYNTSVAHATFMGYYGDWTKQKATEKYTYLDVGETNDTIGFFDYLYKNVTGENSGITWADAWAYEPDLSGNFNYLLNAFGYDPAALNLQLPYPVYHGQMLDANVVAVGEVFYDSMGYMEDFSAMYAGASPYAYVDSNGELIHNDANRIYITNADALDENGGFDMFGLKDVLVLPLVLRNVASLKMTVSNSETGEVYYVDDTTYVPKISQPYYAWRGLDAEGQLVASGTTVDIVFTSCLDYPGATEQEEFRFQATVDYDVPELASDITTNGSVMSMTVRDAGHLHVAEIGGADAATDGIAQEWVFQGEKGQSFELNFDLTQIPEGEHEMYLALLDYAGCYTEFTFTVQGQGAPTPTNDPGDVYYPDMDEDNTVVLKQTFGDLSTLEDWAVYDMDEDNKTWNVYESIGAEQEAQYGYGPEDDGFAMSFSYDDSTYSALHPDNWLVTGSIDLTSVTDDTIYLDFAVKAQDANWAAEKLSVMVANPGFANTTDFTNLFTGVGPNFGGTRDADNWVRVKIDLSAYKGQVIHLAFRHHDTTDQFAVLLDRIVVYTRNSGESPYPIPTPEA